MPQAAADAGDRLGGRPAHLRLRRGRVQEEDVSVLQEKALMEGTDTALVNQLFDVFVRDFSVYATQLLGKPGNSEEQRALIRDLIKAPVANPAQFDMVWKEQVYRLNGTYRMED